VLKRREKRRYISVIYEAGGVSALDAVQKRHAELFGSIALDRASLRLIKDKNGSAIIMRCSLAELGRVLATMAFCHPPIVTLDMSSSMKRLKRRLYDFIL
jgi:RNase P/RNase MRP subunit POP5